MPWNKFESSSNPGHYYYFNSDTNESTWTEPDEWRQKLTLEDCQGGSSGGLAMEQEASSVEEAMVVEERWAEDEEVAMDVNLTEMEQLLSEISATRGSMRLSLPSSSLSPCDNSSYGMSTERLYVVLDTNVLLSHLQFLVELKDFAIKGVGQPVLLVPWVVMQELDDLKGNNRHSGSVSKRARAAIAFLHSCFSAKHPRIRGQKMEEVHTEVLNVAIETNDDRILHCCLLYQEKVKGHGGEVVLFSNDVQLCSKAMINNVRALSRKTLLVELRRLCQAMEKTTPTSYSCTSEFRADVRQVLKEEHSCTVDGVMCESKEVLRKALDAVVVVEMEMAFDSLWETMVIAKPPWTLLDLVTILDKHWVAVFGMVLSTSYRRSCLQHFSVLLTSRKLLLSWNDVNNFISSSVSLLRAFPRRPRYKGVVHRSLACLEVLRTKTPGTRHHPHTPHRQCPVPTRHPQVMATPTPPVQPTATPLTTVGVGMPTEHVPSSHSVVPLSVEERAQLTHTLPDSTELQFAWVLNIMLETTKHCLSRIARSLSCCDSTQMKCQIFSFITLLESVTVSMHQLLQITPDISTLRHFRASVDAFLLTCLLFPCPLSLERWCEIVPTHLPLVLQAMHEFTSAMDTLRLLAQQYSLSP